MFKRFLQCLCGKPQRDAEYAKVRLEQWVKTVDTALLGVPGESTLIRLRNAGRYSRMFLESAQTLSITPEELSLVLQRFLRNPDGSTETH